MSLIELVAQPARPIGRDAVDSEFDHPPGNTLGVFVVDDDDLAILGEMDIEFGGIGLLFPCQFRRGYGVLRRVMGRTAAQAARAFTVFRCSCTGRLAPFRYQTKNRSKYPLPRFGGEGRGEEVFQFADRL